MTLAGVVYVARCPVHGLHGARDTCFAYEHQGLRECDGMVEQIPMVPAADAEVERDALILRTRERDHAAAWAQHLALLIEGYVMPFGDRELRQRVSEGGILEAVERARAAGLDSEVARARLSADLGEPPGEWPR